MTVQITTPEEYAAAKAKVVVLKPLLDPFIKGLNRSNQFSKSEVRAATAGATDLIEELESAIDEYEATIQSAA